VAQADIVLDHLTKAYKSLVSVNDVSAEVQPGEFISMIGPSGCGKSVVLRLIAGLEVPTSGNLYIKGNNMAGIPAYKRNLALVFQSFSLWPHTNVLGNVEFGLKMRGVDKDIRKRKALDALRTVGLEGFEHRRINEMSGGQRQRVGLARALAVDPTVVLLDEPLGALDAKLRIEMQSELKQLQKNMGITFVHVSGEQSEAMAMADRIIVMAEGKFQQIGTPAEIYLTPRTRFVAGFVGKNNVFDGTVESADSDWVRVNSILGTFTLKRSAEFKPESKEVSFVVRAERVHLLAGEQDGITNRVTGTIAGLEYEGSVVTIVLSMCNGQEVKVEQHESLTRQWAPKHGDTLTVGWKPEDTYVLPV
jgi:spermidine/putrescine transport system ATP-binding protein